MHFPTNFFLSLSIGGYLGFAIVGRPLGENYIIDLPKPLPKETLTIIAIATSCLLYFSCGLLADKILPQGAKWSLLKEAGQVLIQLISSSAFTVIETLAIVVACDALGVKDNPLGGQYV